MRALALLTLAALAGCGRDAGADAPVALTGTPCTVVPAVEAESRGYVFRQSLKMGPTLVERQGGRAECTAVGSSGQAGVDGDPSCRLSGPGATRVTTPAGVTYFDIPLGSPAAIIVSDGQPRCVLTEEQKQ